MVYETPPRHISYDQAMSQVVLPHLIEELHIAAVAERRRAMIIPPREVMLSENGQNAFVSMPAYSDEEKLFVTKIGAIIAPSEGSFSPTVNALVVAFCGRTGAIVGTIDGRAVTNIKCAAISGLVSRYCTSNKPHTVAIIGSGVQARQQVWAIHAVREIAELRIFSRRAENAGRFIEEIARSGMLSGRLVNCRTIDEALDGASIVATATTSSTPIGKFENLFEDVHINCMGGHTVESREIPWPILERAVLIVEDRPTAVAEAGLLHERALELEEMVKRQDLPNSITIFSSTGHAFYDYCTAKHLLEHAGFL